MSQVTAAPHIDRPPNANASPGVARATRAEEFIYLFFVLWAMIGLCLDGWAHRYQPELESFFTPWHAVFYTGFIGGTSWVAYMVIRRRPQAQSLRTSVPSGYELAIIGLAMFAVGGVGDGFWHTIFGVETGIDALLSPTHLLLLTGMLAGATAPVRAAWRNAANPIIGNSLGSFLPVALAIAVATTGVAFFFLYANGFNNWPMQYDYRDDALATAGILSTLASTVILIGPTMLLLRRWQPPFGSFTIIYGTVGVFMAGLDAYEYWWQMLAPLVGGIVADVIVRGRQSGSPSAPQPLRNRAWLVGLLVPLAMWSVSTLAIHLAWTIRWPPELWIGQIFMAMLTGFSLALMSHPPANPVNPVNPAESATL
ncbi:MAG: hypothetical protein ACRBK7_01445 [Acidimicrobiales bacterium]